MSDYKELHLFLSALSVNCTIPAQDSVITEFFLLYNFWPIALGFFVLGLTIIKCDYVILLLTVTNFIDNSINFGLRTAVGVSNNIQPENCPIDPTQMPALSSERITVLYTVIWFLATFTYPCKVGRWFVVVGNFVSVLALYSRMYLRFSTPQQMFAGCGVGLIEGFILSIFFYFLKVHHYDMAIVNLLKN